MLFFTIETTLSTPSNPSNPRVTRCDREGATAALFKLLAEIENVHYRVMEFVKSYQGNDAERVRVWSRIADEIDQKLDAVVSLHRNPQLETFLSFGLLVKFDLPNGESYEVHLTCLDR